MTAAPLIPDEMKRVYIQRRSGDLVKLEDALTRRDPSVFERIGHQLKGNASTYGYPDLEDIGIRLEEIKSLSDTAEALELIREFKEWIARQETVLAV